MSAKNLSQLKIFHLKQGNNEGLLVVGITDSRGGARHFHLGGPLEGPVLQQGSCQWSV